MLAQRAIQAKLRVNTPGDEFEREADNVADTVMRMFSPAAEPPRIQRACAGCKKELEQNRIQRLCTKCDEELHRKRGNGQDVSGISSGLAFNIQAIQGGGEPLSQSLREYFEPRFGHDFRGVRIHTTGRDAGTAAEINALAYTMGNHIVFGPGQFAPDSSNGRRVLAHELTHVVQQGASPLAPPVQRLGDTSKLPPGFSCPVAVDSPSSEILDFQFPNRGTALNPSQKSSIEGFIVSRRALGITGVVRVDGYASPAGSDPLNWQLSCDRARAVEAELLHPSSGRVPGLPPSEIALFAQGETNEFSRTTGPDRDGPNRRASISGATAPPPPPPPVCPAVPGPTPATCSTRNSAYCAAAACFPTNPWLPCVCRASADVCRAVEAFNLRGSEGAALSACLTATGTSTAPVLAKASWFDSTNRCIWGHWRAAFDAIHDPTGAVPTGLTPEWAAAVTTCRSSGIGSSACCTAHVVAEQTAIDRCGGYPTATFGPLPTDVPGSSTCSTAVLAGARAAGPPAPFTTGDFGNVSDRISYGVIRCCP